ncbi:hypothetical protein [Spiroplasma endosymbiont of Acasis viretata]|uniref:hypothetical protein n=1 Tax=Spiroplasma endosymbiont of Acasis viretata TaxID=3066306 RepID=UPI00313BB646
MTKKEPKLDAFKNWNKDLELKPKQEKDKLTINETDNLEKLILENQSNLEIIKTGNREKKFIQLFIYQNMMLKN